MSTLLIQIDFENNEQLSSIDTFKYIYKNIINYIQNKKLFKKDEKIFMNYKIK